MNMNSTKVETLISQLDPNKRQCPKCKNYLDKKNFYIECNSFGRNNLCDKCYNVNVYRKKYMR